MPHKDKIFIFQRKFKWINVFEGGGGGVTMFNATFNNISYIVAVSFFGGGVAGGRGLCDGSVLLVEEWRVGGGCVMVQFYWWRSGGREGVV